MSGVKPGSHVAIEKGGGLYHHHAIYIGNQQVIEYLGFGGYQGFQGIEVGSYADFKGRGKTVVVKYPKKFSGEEVVKRAMSRRGENEYNLAFNNCEHFCIWARTGEHRSAQVENVKENWTVVSILGHTVLAAATAGHSLPFSAAAIGGRVAADAGFSAWGESISARGGQSRR